MSVAPEQPPAVQEFRIEDDASPGGRVVAVYGELDQYVAPELRDRLVRVVDAATESPIVVDLTGVTFIDSMTLGVLLGAHKRARAAGRDLRLVIPDNEIRRIFEITLLDRIFGLARTRDEAFAMPASDA